MESDSIKSDEGDKQKQNSDNLPNFKYLDESIRIRCTDGNFNPIDRKLLGRGYAIVLWCSLFSWIIFLLFRD